MVRRRNCIMLMNARQSPAFTRYFQCIKPNAEKRANSYNEQMVLDQLRYLDMLGIIRIHCKGYPVDFGTFSGSYSCLCKGIQLPKDVEDAAVVILKHLKHPLKEWQV
jgi:myosin heavy subunit